MRFRFFRLISPLSTRERMIREHAQWLTRAVRRPRGYPRIPVRKVSEGGYAGLMASPNGRSIADGWWHSALERLD